MKFCLRVLRHHIGAIAVFGAVINVLLLTVPIYMLQLYDRVLSSRSVETLISLTAITVFLLLVMAALDVLRARLLVRMGTVLHESVSARLFNAMIERAAAHPRDAVREAQKDLHDIRQFVSGTGLVAIIDAPWAVVFMTVIFIIHPLLGSVALAGAVLLFGLALMADFSTREGLRDAGTATLRADRTMGESLANVDAVRVMGMTGRLRQRWLNRQYDAVSRQDGVGDRLGGLTAISKSMRLMMQVAMLGAGAWLALRQIITPGFMIAASIIMARALAPVEQALVAWRGFSAARQGYGRLDGLFSEIPEREAAMPAPAPAARLTVKELFGGPPGAATPVVKGVSMRLEPGTVLGIVGPSAAGKTTLVKLLVGAWPPSVGDVRLDGAEVCRMDARDMGRHIGYLPQEAELFEGSVRDNISRFSGGEPERIVRAARLAGIHDMILRFPDGYDTAIGPEGVVLSGGQKQRIAMARAFFGDPVLIVMDEPDAHLDEDGLAALFHALVELKREGRVIVVTTHRPAMMNAIDRLMILRNGAVDLFGPTRNVLSRVRARSAAEDPELKKAEDGPGVSRLPASFGSQGGADHDRAR